MGGEQLFLGVTVAQFNERRIKNTASGHEEYFRLTGNPDGDWLELGRGVPTFNPDGALYDPNTARFYRFKVIHKEFDRFGWLIEMIDELPVYWHCLRKESAS